MMNIGMILDCEFPPDLRVEQEMLTLAKLGFDVHLLCYDFTFQRPEIERLHESITIHRIKVTKKFHNKFNALAPSLPIYFAFWKKQVKKFISQNKIAIIHVHDLRLAQVGDWASKKFNIHYILDLHENYPAALRFYAFTNSFPGKLFISFKQWEKYERNQVQKADGIVAVIEEMAERLYSLGVTRDKIFIVPNYINVDSFDQNVIKTKIDKKEDEIFLFYSGGFDRHRGLETLIHAMKHIQPINPKIKLHLVGSGRTESDLREKVDRLNLNNVTFHGWQQERAIPSFIEAIDIGIVPHLKNAHTDSTIPHKLFQYLYKQKPVVVSNCNPLKRLVEEMHSGLVFESCNDKDLAEKILSLVENPELQLIMSKNGYDSIIKKYNWKTSGEELKKLYEKISTS